MAHSSTFGGRWGPRAIAASVMLIAVACTSTPAATTAPATAQRQQLPSRLRRLQRHRLRRSGYSCSGDRAPATAAPATPEAPLSLAYLSFAVANSYDAPMLGAAQAAAAARNTTLTVLDANNSPDTQLQQLTDALAGDYDGIIVQPIFGPGLIPTITEGIADDAQIGVLDQILGEDLTTSENAG